MRGVITSIAPKAAIIDITHGIPPQNVMAGALALRESWRFFPPLTIFVAVVDPGVGTYRHPIAVQTRSGARFVGPDNGVLWLAAEQAGFKGAVELRSPPYIPKQQSATFHGRDVFAPAAAHLWNGVDITRLGPPVVNLQRLSLGELVQSNNEICGEVIYIDGYGNLVSNLERFRIEELQARFPARKLLVRIHKSDPISVFRTYADAPSGAPLALFGSFEMLEVAVRDGNAAQMFAAGPGTQIRVRAES